MPTLVLCVVSIVCMWSVYYAIYLVDCNNVAKV